MSLRHALAALALVAAGQAAAAAEFELLRITPAGEDVEPDGQQIVLAFDRAVVPLGRMERRADELPVTITPPLPCEWRWLDPQNLACNLPPDQPLPPATAYTVELRAELAGLDGARLARAVRHRFVTRRPTLQYAVVDHWRAPTVPVFTAQFDQPVSAASLAVAARIAGEAVTVEPVPEDSTTPYWVPALHDLPAGEARSRWRIAPAAPLAAERDGELVIGAGLVSALGPERGPASARRTPFRTFGAFRLLGLRCTDARGRQVAANATAACNPLIGPTLEFSAPVVARDTGRRLAIAPDPKGGRSDYDPWANAWGGGSLSTDNRGGARYTLAWPFTLKAAQDYRVAGGTDIRDVFGRPLPQPFEQAFRTAHRSPGLSFSHPLAVLEAGVDSEVPAIVTNLTGLELDVTCSAPDGVARGVIATRPVAAARDIAFAMPLDVRSLLAGRSGVVDGWLRTVPPVRAYPKDRPGEPLFAQVTPWQVHAKFGHYDTLVWVTEFATGKPVAGASVSLFVARPPVWAPEDASAPTVTTDADGLAVLPGAADADPTLQLTDWNSRTPLAVRVVKAGEQAVLPLSDDFSVDPWRASGYAVYAGRQPRHGHLRSWGTTAQGVYRAGDTVQFKLYVRNDASRRLSLPEAGPYRLSVIDPAGVSVHEQAGLRLSPFGALDGSFVVPKQGKVGWYRFELEATYTQAARRSDDGAPPQPDILYPMQVLVSDFTPAPFRLAAEIRATRVAPGDAVTAAVRATMHAGGPFGGAPAAISARLIGAAFTSADPRVAGFRFADDASRDPRESRGIRDVRAVTGADGEFGTEIRVPESSLAWGTMAIEGTVQDDRGRSIAATASVPFAGRDRYIGLKSGDWLLAQGRATEVATIVVDADGRPVAGQPQYVKIERREVKVAKVKDAGNVYVSRYSERWRTVQVCKGRSRAVASRCAYTPDAGGEYRITARVRDRRNRLHTASVSKWASGKDGFVWESADDYSLGLEADRTSYKVGDVARVLVRNPYPGATALITTERYGVLDRRVQRLDGSTPVIDIPITADHLPGFYLSVVVQSPRVAAAPPDGDVDLGKPAFRMGYAAIAVDDPLKRIEVTVKAERERYRPRDTARVSITAVPRLATRQPVELAVAVVDEAVFDLIRDGETYFDPYAGFNRLDPLDLANYSLLTRLVGRQKFEKKGANPGGDGGADLSLRSVEQFVAYWNPSLIPDAQGRSTFDVTLPDNLTAWKVLVLAVTPDDRFGLGSGRFTASRETELRPVLPNQVVGGDRFRAGFSVLNRAAGPRTVDVTIKASGAATAAHRETVPLAAFERKTVFVDLAVADDPANAAGSIAFTATAGDAKDRDALAVRLPVTPRRPTVTAADSGALDAGGRSEIPVEAPAGSRPGGEIAVRLSPTVLGQLDGAFGYLRDYPYACWEQRLSRGVMAAQYGRLKPWLDPAFVWADAEGLATRMFADAASFQAPNGGMSFWLPEDRHASPYLSAYTALAFEWLREAGAHPPAAVQTKLDGYLDGLLKRDAPSLSAEGNAALRAMVLDVLARRGVLAVAELDRFAPALPRMGLFGQALYLDAARRVEGAERHRRRALELMLARGQQSAGSLVLRETPDRDWDALLGSELRANCAALGALVATDDPAIDTDPGLRELPGALVRAISAAQGRRTHWPTTQDNVFCTAALEQYARRYESAAPSFTLEALLDGQPFGRGRFTAVRDTPVVAARALSAGDIGRRQQLAIQHSGEGRGYYAATVRHVPGDADARAVNAGLAVARQFEVWRDGRWQPLAGAPMTIVRGDRVRVTVTLDTPVARPHLVVDDPLPGALEPLNPELATASGLATEDAEPPGTAYPYPFQHRELRASAARWFGDRVPAGRHRLVWIGQAVAVGEFAVPATHAEAMYDPDVFGNGLPARLLVSDAPATR